MKAGSIAPRRGIPLGANTTPMQRSGRRNYNTDRRSKKMKRYEPRQNEPELGMHISSKAQGYRQHQ